MSSRAFAPRTLRARDFRRFGELGMESDCRRQGRTGGAQPALPGLQPGYNGLVIAWPELTKLALAERSKTKDTQQEMF